MKKWIVIGIAAILISISAGAALAWFGPLSSYLGNTGRVIGAFALPDGDSVIVTLQDNGSLQVIFANADGTELGPAWPIGEPEQILLAVCGDKLKIIINDLPVVQEYVVELGKPSGICTEEFMQIYFVPELFVDYMPPTASTPVPPYPEPPSSR